MSLGMVGNGCERWPGRGGRVAGKQSYFKSTPHCRDLIHQVGGGPRLGFGRKPASTCPTELGLGSSERKLPEASNEPPRFLVPRRERAAPMMTMMANNPPPAIVFSWSVRSIQTVPFVSSGVYIKPLPSSENGAVANSPLPMSAYSMPLLKLVPSPTLFAGEIA